MNRFDRFFPGAILKPYVKCFVISESDDGQAYNVLPDTSVVIGIQFKGRLSNIINGTEKALAPLGITGLQNGFRIFKSTAGIGTVLVYFTETGASAFISHPVNELFDQSLSLDHFFSPSLLSQLREQLSEASTDEKKIEVVELFLISQLKFNTGDVLVAAAISHIRQTKGMVRIKDLAALLNISQSPLEKRFRKVVGASPKKFASIVRLQSLINQFEQGQLLTNTGLQSGYYDQAHFIKDFKTFTGQTPEKFLRKK